MVESLENRIFAICKELYGQKVGFYLEAGANDGIRASTTLALEKELGWSGILVEPSASAFRTLIENRSQENVFVECALVKSQRIRTVRGLFGTSALTNTADRVIVAKLLGKHQTVALKERLRKSFRDVKRLLDGKRLAPSPGKSMVRVRGKTLDSLLAASKVQRIDLLSLDVEGAEVSALKGFSFIPRPRILVIEVRGNSQRTISKILEKHGYRLLGYLTWPNNEPLDSELWHRDGVWVVSNDSEAVRVVSRHLVQRSPN